MHLSPDLTWGNLLTILFSLFSAAYAGGKLVQVLKALGEKVSVLEGEFDRHQREFRQHEKDEYEAFGKIHEQLIELALKNRRTEGT